MFMSGACDKALPESRYRMSLAGRLLSSRPMPHTTGGGIARAR